VNIIGGDFIEIPVTVEGEGLHGVVRALKAAGYYAAVLGNLGDVMVIYGVQSEHLNSRVPYVALVGDTIRVLDRSADCQEHKYTNRQ
jgi:hypothetical protein